MFDYYVVDIRQTHKYPNECPVLLSTWQENPKLCKNNVCSISHIYNVNIECNIDFQTV